MNKVKDDQEVSYDDGEPYEEELVKIERSSDDNNNKVVVAVTEAQKNSSGEVAMHECNICFKTFKNGKALGGHRRSHFQAAKVKSHFSNLSKTTRTNNKNNKKVVSDDDDDSDSDDNDGKHTCYLCKKDFPSSHSLYGHMRSHPERVWRGICPPIHSDHKYNSNNNNNNKHSSSSSSRIYDLEDDYDYGDDCDEVVAPAIDLSKSYSLPRWQQTGKRGRQSTSAYEAAEILVFMSLRYNKSFASDESMVDEPKSPESLIISYKRKNTGEASTSQTHAPKMIKFNVSDSLKLENQNDGCDSYKDERVSLNMDCKEEIEKDSGSISIKESTQDHSFGVRKKMMKKVNGLLLKKPKGQDSESEDKNFLSKESTQKKVDGYKCDICLKSFLTFQGLGGHRSIHNRKKNNVLNIAESKYSDPIADDDDDAMRGPVMEEANDKFHTEDASSSQFRVPKFLDFDLNMLPDDMHD
ncbi:hypothetical protein TanjilG_14171 [Lupinus angustifolius]|uniref:C2H2-type domain-containing protein n=1 Tax=Lupinus angustifolius TaxID=3871 RepID=A0A1J7HK92_LUPAN|nr:hypothetical protein TanjilG_14171 [Lupinus angustifolius]